MTDGSRRDGSRRDGKRFSGDELFGVEDEGMAETLALTFQDPDSNPYFLWSEDMTVSQLRDVLAGKSGEQLREVYLARLLREARLKDVWEFVAPADILASWPRIHGRLGKKRKLWQLLLDTWVERGYLKR